MSSIDPGQAESIRQRLRNRARSKGEDAQYMLERYALERLLFRLGQSPHRARFVLKGAALFALWGGPAYRPTRDLDFTCYGDYDTEAVCADFRALCAIPDSVTALVFDPTSVVASPIRDESEYGGLRLNLNASLGKSLVNLQVDIGFGNRIEPAPRDEVYPTLLNDPAPRIRAYPHEAVVAEKLHALSVLGFRNSRMKDFYDLYVLSEHFPFQGQLLTRAVAATFERRRTPFSTALPVGLTAAFYADAERGARWGTYLNQKNLPGAPTDFAQTGDRCQAFLLPIWNGLASGTPFERDWPAGGPWGKAEG